MHVGVKVAHMANRIKEKQFLLKWKKKYIYLYIYILHLQLLIGISESRKKTAGIQHSLQQFYCTLVFLFTSIFKIGKMPNKLINQIYAH
jgi:hypothetical protein